MKKKCFYRILNIPSTSKSVIRIIFISSHEKGGINYETKEISSSGDEGFSPEHLSLFLWQPGYTSCIV